LMHHEQYYDNQVVIQKGEKVQPALYFVRKGSVSIEIKDQEPQIIGEGGYFGEKNMLLDQNKDGQKHYSMRSPIHVTAHGEETNLDVLYLEECRKVVDTTLLGLGQSTAINTIDSSFQWDQLTRHALLGSGSFGQVWLASHPSTSTTNDTDSDSPTIVALKVQPKHKLLQAEQAERVVAERNIMASLHSPFLIRLYHAYQDDHRLFMITSLLQGGELESLIPQDGLSEEAAKFYAAGILEGLTYMHRRHILHRDVKTANVLLNEKGYPVLIDMGFGAFHCFVDNGVPFRTVDPEI
jgi:Protein kinase domain/Cyclic nucleotide-binding domain